VAFVGFLAAHAQAIFGPEHLLLAGIAGAVIVTWYTFLPSFLFVLGGGPLVEATRDDIKFVAPLTAITAAVVGVILNLALFFGYHVLWPQGLEGAFDPWSAVLVLAAMVALFTLRRGVTEVILVAGVVGLLLRLAGAT
jgi:chromate transporter